MIKEAEFVKRFKKRLEQSQGQVEEAWFLAECADSSWERHEDDPDDMSPEDYADSDMDCWYR